MSKDQIDTVERMTNAAAALDWLAEQGEGTPAQRGASAKMIAALALARAYVVEYAVHCSRGGSPEAAIAATAKCELGVAERTESYRRLLN